MKTHYVDEYFTPIYSEDTNIVPRIGEKVKLNEEFYVADVNYDPQVQTIFVILSQFKPSTTSKITESSNQEIKSKVSLINNTLVETFKEIKSLKSRIQNLEQNIRQILKSK